MKSKDRQRLDRTGPAEFCAAVEGARRYFNSRRGSRAVARADATREVAPRRVASRGDHRDPFAGAAKAEAEAARLAAMAERPATPRASGGDARKRRGGKRRGRRARGRGARASRARRGWDRHHPGIRRASRGRRSLRRGVHTRRRWSFRCPCTHVQPRRRFIRNVDGSVHPRRWWRTIRRLRARVHASGGRLVRCSRRRCVHASGGRRLVRCSRRRCVHASGGGGLFGAPAAAASTPAAGGGLFGAPAAAASRQRRAAAHSVPLPPLRPRQRAAAFSTSAAAPATGGGLFGRRRRVGSGRPRAFGAATAQPRSRSRRR